MTSVGRPDSDPSFTFEVPAETTPPRVLWASPGSLFLSQLSVAWENRCSLADLAEIGGPWALVLADPSAGHTIIITDPIGVQPLYWARTSTGKFAVSSWLQSLVERPDVDSSIDYEGVLLDSTTALFSEATLHRTRFASVARLPWGSALRVRADGSTVLERYWDPGRLPGPDSSMTLSDSAELLRERIDAAVRRLTPIDTPVGGHVSGGLDCTSMSCRANQVLQESGRELVAGYSWAPSERHVARFDGDERSLLDAVRKQESLAIRTIDADGSGDWFFELNPDLYPQTTHARERFVLPQARADGVRVMLSGWGGDELASFNGRGVLRHLARTGRVRAVWNQTSKRVKLTGTPPVGFGKQARSFTATMLDASPGWIDPRHRAERRDDRAVDAEIDAALRSVSSVAADARRTRMLTFRQASDHHEFQLALLMDGHLQRRCEGWYQTGQLFDLSYRYPLLDLGVVKAALQLPWWAFTSSGWTRTAFRMAVEPWVPSAVAWNTTKSEPSRFAPPSAAESHAEAPTWRADDDEYRRMIHLASQVSRLRVRRVRRPEPIRDRSNAAPVR